MTDREIVRAAEWCWGCTSDRCRNCPLEYTAFCEEKLQDLIIDLINRQKAENSNLTSRLTSLQNDLTSARAEIERLTEVLNAAIAGQETLQRYIEASMPSGWIESTDRLPETGDQDYLVVVSGKFKNVTFQNALELAYYSKSDGWILETWPMAKDLKISHWMPLPDSPLPKWQDAMLRTFLGEGEGK